MKKSYIPIILTVFLMLPINAYSKSGPPIPTSISISEAIEIANNYFHNEERHISDQSLIKKSEYIIISVNYKSQFRSADQKDWAWYIKFVHPRYNDHSVEYKITNDKKIVLVSVTE